MASLPHVAYPALPGGIAEVTGTVAAPQQVDLQNVKSGPCQRTRLQCCHAAGLVHLFGKGVDVQHQASGDIALGWVKQAKPLAALGRCGRQKKSLWLHRRELSGSQFSADKVSQRAHRGKG